MEREEYYKQELIKELKKGNLASWITEERLNSCTRREIIDYGNIHFKGRDLRSEYYYKYEK